MFTDEDLKRVREQELKLWVVIDQDKGHDQNVLPALLARLDAAEQMAKTIIYVRESWKNEHFALTLDSEIERWLASKGQKEGAS